MLRTRLLIVPAITFMVVMTPTAPAATIHVDVANCPGPGNGSEAEPYCSIQSAIDVAIVGDEILVAPGSYVEAIDYLGKNIAIGSTEGAAVTSISSPDIVVRITNGESRAAVLDGFTITSATNRGLRILSSSPTVRNCVFANGLGGISIGTGSPLIEWCEVSGNNGADGGAGIFIHDQATPVIQFCVISDNVATVLGGGLKAQEESDVLILNSLIINNTAANIGGGIRNISSTITLVGCVISVNQSISGNGGGIRNSSGHVELRNCVLWGNSPNQISNASGGTADVAYSCVEGGYAGAGNIAVDPLFEDVSGDDFRLQTQSPCIDAGDNTAVPPTITIDLDENPRFADIPGVVDTGVGTPPLVDIGAYEVQPPACVVADIDGDGSVDIGDFLLVLAQWGPCPPQCLGDVDGDGEVGILDFLLVLANWGPCP